MVTYNSPRKNDVVSEYFLQVSSWYFRSPKIFTEKKIILMEQSFFPLWVIYLLSHLKTPLPSPRSQGVLPVSNCSYILSPIN